MSAISLFCGGWWLRNSLVVGSKLIVHLKPNGGFRFRLPKEARERLAGLKSVKGMIRGVEFEARIDNGFRLCLPTWIKSIMNDGGISLCLDLSDDEAKLVELEGAQGAPSLANWFIFGGIPVAGSPRYRRGFGYCSRCTAAYPLIFTRCPICNTLLRHGPRRRGEAANAYKAPRGGIIREPIQQTRQDGEGGSRG